MVSWTSASMWEEGIMEECLLYTLELCCDRIVRHDIEKDRKQKGRRQRQTEKH